MSKMPRSLMIFTEDEFQYWLFHFDDVLLEFENFVPKELQAKLDYSIEALDALEAWLLDRYPDIDTITTLDQRGILDGASRYVGQIYQVHLDGKWEIDVIHQDNAYYGLPLINYSGGSNCPMSLVTASLDRRTGTFMSSILNNHLT